MADTVTNIDGGKKIEFKCPIKATTTLSADKKKLTVVCDQDAEIESGAITGGGRRGRKGRRMTKLVIVAPGIKMKGKTRRRGSRKGGSRRKRSGSRKRSSKKRKGSRKKGSKKRRGTRRR